MNVSYQKTSFCLFLIILLSILFGSSAAWACRGDITDTFGFGPPDGQVNLSDLNYLLNLMVANGLPPSYTIPASMAPNADVADINGQGMIGGDGQIGICDVNFYACDLMNYGHTGFVIPCPPGLSTICQCGGDPTIQVYVNGLLWDGECVLTAGDLIKVEWMENTSWYGGFCNFNLHVSRGIYQNDFVFATSWQIEAFDITPDGMGGFDVGGAATTSIATQPAGIVFSFSFIIPQDPPTDYTITVAPDRGSYLCIMHDELPSVTLPVEQTPLPCKAYNPNPAHGAPLVSLSTLPSWSAGRYADSHDVYFGTNPDPSADFQGNQIETTYDPGILSSETTYYWRIDERNENGATVGDVWSFTTGTDLTPQKAGNPFPADSAIAVFMTSLLNWTAGSGTTSHEVYFGTNPDPSSDFQGNQIETTYDPGTLVNNTTYYWRIDEKNEYGTTIGDLWSFTTGCSGGGVQATGRRTITQPLEGHTAHGFHFKTYQADRDTAWILDWNIDISESYGDVTMESDDWPFDDGKNHSVTVDYTGMSVPYNTQMNIDVTFCLNEYNTVKFADMYWTYSHDPVPALPADIGWSLAPQPGSSAGGWVVGKYTVKDLAGNVVAIDMIGHEYTENELPSVENFTVSNGTPDDPGTESVIITDLGVVAMDHLPSWEEVESYQPDDWDVYITTDMVLPPDSTVTAATLKLLSPNGSEILQSGSVTPVTWQSTVEITDVNIDFSVNDGANWHAVDPPNSGNTGQYDWQVPLVHSEQCRIRIKDSQSSEPNDVSDAVFTITSDYPEAIYRKTVRLCQPSPGNPLLLTIYREDGHDDVSQNIVDCENHCDPNFIDINFFDENQYPLTYWIEEISNDGNDHYAQAWIQANSSSIIYLYYGQTWSTPSQDSLPTQFQDEFVENFESGSLAGWTFDGSRYDQQTGSICPGIWRSELLNTTEMQGDYVARVLADSDATCDPWSVRARMNRAIATTGSDLTLEVDLKMVDAADGRAQPGNRGYSYFLVGVQDQSGGYTYGFDKKAQEWGDQKFVVSDGEQLTFKAAISTDYQQKYGRLLDPNFNIFFNAYADYDEDGAGRRTADVHLDMIRLRGTNITDPNWCDFGPEEHVGWCRAGNLDGLFPVNLFDFALLASDWMAYGSGLTGDITLDWSVDTTDLGVLIDFWLLDCCVCRDYDGDGYGDPADECCDFDQSDCDDERSDVYPGALEFCDGVDNNCNSEIDEPDAANCLTYYLDEDQDTYGKSDDSRCLCSPEGFYTATNDGDCDDTDADIYPGADEYCDGKDNDCDTIIDEDNAVDCVTYYLDQDLDNYGLDSDNRCLCSPENQYTTLQPGDCDDNDPNLNPAMPEICDDLIDNDCDDLIDENDPDCCWDNDLDGFDDEICGGEDCDDSDPNVNPGVTEICDNGLDDDCDGDTDCEDSDCSGGDICPPLCWSSPTQCHGDTNDDAILDPTDLQALMNAFNTCYGNVDYNPCADFNQDGMVNTNDLTIFVTIWPNNPNPPYPSVPADCIYQGPWPPINLPPWCN